MSLFIRSFIVLIISSILIFFYSFVCLLAWGLPLSYRHALIRSYLQIHIFLLKFICRIHYEVSGLENIPHDRAAVILSKHQSTWETFFLPLIFQEPAIIVKRELLWIPFFGWGLATTNPISINRSNQKTAMQQIITQGKKCLAEGRSILIFPEGTRILPGKTGKYKIGGARLAVAAHAPLLPIAHNAGLYWRKGQFIKTPGTIKVIIGPVIETKEQTPEEVLHMAKTWIEETVTKIID
jgi:1-acyl-sn-glycerol-3-phosphate acyltransferase